MPTVKNEVKEQFNIFKYVQYEQFLAGISGGFISTLVLHPIDLMKIRFAVNDGRTKSIKSYQSIINGFVTVVKEERFKGLYKGALPNLIGATSSWGLYFLFYNSIKKNLQQGDETQSLSPFVYFLSASSAGTLTLLITNPIWVVKTRLCLQYSNVPSNNSLLYKGLMDALKKIYKYEGVRGLYKGLVPGLFGTSHGAVQFMVYEELKNRYNKYNNRDINVKLKTTEYLVCAALSKLIAVSLTYPYQVIRSRLQCQHTNYSGAIDCIKKTFIYESWRGFYKGLSLNLIRVVPTTMITLVVYENVIAYLNP